MPRISTPEPGCLLVAGLTYTQTQMKRRPTVANLKDVNLLAFGNTINLAGAIYMGEGKLYLTMLPEYRGYVDHDGERSIFEDKKSDEAFELEELDLTREDWRTFMRQTDIMETEILQNAGEDRGLVKAIVRKSARQISQNTFWKVYRRDNFLCRYCGANDCPLTMDHLVLWENGGPSEMENLLSSCKRCNNKRGNMQYATWLQDKYYLRVSKNLTADTRQANEDILSTLDSIPRLIHKRSSR